MVRFISATAIAGLLCASTMPDLNMGMTIQTKLSQSSDVTQALEKCPPGMCGHPCNVKCATHDDDDYFNITEHSGIHWECLLGRKDVEIAECQANLTKLDNSF